VRSCPAPDTPPAPLPRARSVSGESPHRRPAEGGELEGVRTYRRGDPLRRVVWKKAAKTGQLVSRDTSVSTQQELWLEYQATHVPGVEQRLSRLGGRVVGAHT